MSKDWMEEIIEHNNPGLPPEEVKEAAQDLRTELKKKIDEKKKSLEAGMYLYEQGYNQALVEIKEIIG